VFEERRPFFVEGGEILTGKGLSFLGRPTWFYSRRIGAPPRGAAAGDFVKQPSQTTIVSAAKVTGRLASGMTVGLLAAVTPREYADVFNSVPNAFSKIAVGPPTAFGVLRLQQEFGTQQSNVGFSLTQTHRALDERGGLRDLLASNAVAGGVDWRLRYNEGMWELTGFAGGSHVVGDPVAMALLQRSSAHYFQRPDQTHISFDPARTSLTGYSASVRGDKNAGRYTLGGIQLSLKSPGFEINDAGQMRRADAIDFNMDIQLRDTKPHKYWRYWQAGTSTVDGWNFGGDRQYAQLNENVNVTLPNFWRATARATRSFGSLVDDLSRGGPLMMSANGYVFGGSLGSRPNVPKTWNASALHYSDDFGGWRWDFSGSVGLRPASRWEATITPGYSHVVDPRQYVTTLDGGSAATFGKRYVFSFVESSTLSMQLRLNYAFTPNFTAEAYAEPFAASGRFYNFGELAAPRVAALRTYGGAGTGTTIVNTADGAHVVQDGASTFTLPALDFNRLSFRSNLVLRWEWLPGSTAYLIWQQNRDNLESVGRLIGPHDLWNSTHGAGANFLAIKISYWLGVK
jgi:hypothetical protein